MDKSRDQPRSLRDAILRRPILPAAGCFILGIFAHPHLPLHPLLALAIAAGALLLILLLRSRPAMADALLALAIFLCGSTAAQLQAFYYPPHHIAHFTTDQPRLAQLELQIDQPPRLLQGQSHLPPRQVTQANVLRILTPSGWQPATGRILVQVDDPHPNLAMAQHIRVLGMLHRPAPAMNPGQFDWSRYYRDQRLLASISIANAYNLTILASPPPSQLDRLRQFVRDTLQRGFSPGQSLDHALLRALVLGDPDPQLRDVQDDFVRTGTSHHLAISGMHVAILGGFVYLVCRLLLLDPRLATWIGLLFVILYGLLALPSPPVVRSVLLCIAYAVGVLNRRSLDGVQLLSVSVLAMLIYHPLDLYSPGFQLSFLTVLGLMLFTRRCMAFLDSFRDIHEQVALSARRLTRRERFFRWLRRSLTEAIIASLVAWCVSAPLIVWHFNQLSPYAVVASLLLAIPVLLALIGGLLKILLTLLLPSLATTWASLAATPIQWMRHLVDGLATLPGSDAPLPAPSLWIILAAYLLLCLPLLPKPQQRLRWLLRTGPAASCLLIVLFPLLIQSPPIPPARLRLTLLSVGAGQCTVVHLPSGKTVLIDAGSSSIADLARKVITPYLKHAGLRRIDALFISHANHDHFSAAADLVSRYNIPTIYTTPHFADPAAQLFLQTLPTPPKSLASGQRLVLDPDTTLEVLWPPAAGALKPNDTSLVLRLTCFGRSILFPGDVQQAAQSSLLSQPDILRSDVLIAPHHGGLEPTTERFLAAVQPQFILSSNDRTLTQKQRQLDKLAGSTSLYRTHRDGAITLTINSQGQLAIQTFMHGDN